MQTPCVARFDSTRFALVIAANADSVTMVQYTGAAYDIVRMLPAQFAREYTPEDGQTFVGKKAPTVERFLEVLAATSIDITDAARAALKELTMQSTIIAVNRNGNVEDAATPKSILLDMTRPLHELDDLIVAKLGERSLAVFVSSVLKLEKPLTRVKKENKLIRDALVALTKQKSPLIAAAKTMTEKKKTPRTTTAPAKTSGKKGGDAPRTPGAKRQIHDLLVSGGKGTLAEIAAKVGATETTSRTALTDLKNPKYAIDGKPLKIVKNEKGVYSLAK